MTRRQFLSILPASLISIRTPAATPVTVPVRVIIDGKVYWRRQSLEGFWWGMWPEAVRTLATCGVRLQAVAGTGEIARPPYREPIISGLDPAALNIVVTNRIPMQWDSGRGLGGVTLRYRGCHVCMIALAHAHENQVPWLSLNTVLHEVLHALLLDIFQERPDGLSGQIREFRVDACATSLWLFHSGAAIRESARRYVERLKAEAIPRT